MSRPLIPRLLPLVAAALFLGLAAPQLQLPGLHNDEAQEAGLPALQIASGAPADAFRGVSLAIGGRRFPLMVQDYIGAVNVYLSVPFVAALGPTPVALRAMTLALGALSLLLLYAALAECASPNAAGLAALLLAAHPSFVFWTRQGVYVSSVTLCLWLAACWAGARWSRRGGWPLAFLIGGLSGVGVYAKLLFVWVIGGFAAALVVVNLWRWAAGSRRSAAVVTPNPPSPSLWPRAPRPGELLAGLLGGALGLAPLAAYNLLSGGTLASIAANLSTSYYGVNNLDVLANLAARFDQFRAVLAGRDHLWYLGGSFGDPYTEWALLAAAIGLLASGLRPGARFASGPLFPLVLLFAFAQTAFTVSGVFPTHFAILLPLPAAVLGIAFDRALRWAGEFQFRSRARAAIPLLAFAPVLLLVGRDVWVNVNYHRALAASGGLGPHSDAVYRLNDYLDEFPEAPLVAMDWGFAPQLRYLSAGRLTPAEVFGYSWDPDPGFADRLAVYFDDPEAIYIFHWPQETIIPRREAFEAMLAERGLAASVLVDIARRDGAPVFQVIRVFRVARGLAGDR